MTGRWLVVSPHCDDAVLSIGAAICRHVRAGGSTTIVTVLAGDPSSVQPPGPWDAAGGFSSEGEAARERRREDAAACRTVGARPVHLDASDEQYRRGDPADEVWRRLRGLAAEHDEVLLPGHPLAHPDHWMVADRTRAALRSADDPVCLRLYAEEPYLTWARTSPTAAVPHALATGWHQVPAPLPDRVRKLAAVVRYRSQLPLLAPAGAGHRPLPRLRLLARLWRSTARGEWLSDPVPWA